MLFVFCRTAVNVSVLRGVYQHHITGFLGNEVQIFQTASLLLSFGVTF